MKRDRSPWSAPLAALRRLPQEVAAPYRALFERARRRDRRADDDLMQMWRTGLTVSRTLVAPCGPGRCRNATPRFCAAGGRVCHAARTIGIVIQPDGDVMLSLPPEFAGTDTEVETARDLFAEAQRRLARLPDASLLIVTQAAVTIGSDLATLLASGAIAMPLVDTLLAPEILGIVPAALLASRYLAVPAVRRLVRWGAPRLFNKWFGRQLGGPATGD